MSQILLFMFWGISPLKAPVGLAFRSVEAGVWREPLLAKMAQNENKAISY
jgi:hypothetical protein